MHTASAAVQAARARRLNRGSPGRCTAFRNQRSGLWRARRRSRSQPLTPLEVKPHIAGIHNRLGGLLPSPTPNSRLLGHYRLIVAENPQAKSSVALQVLLLLRIVRLELAIDKLDPLDFGLGVDTEPQLRPAEGLYLSHQTQPPKRTREGRFSPSRLHSVLQYGVNFL